MSIFLRTCLHIKASGLKIFLWHYFVGIFECMSYTCFFGRILGDLSLCVCAWACVVFILQLTEKWWHVLNIICGTWFYAKWELCVVVGAQFIFLPSTSMCVRVSFIFFESLLLLLLLLVLVGTSHRNNVVVCGRFFPLHHFEVWPFDFYHSMMTIFNGGNINNQCANSMFFVRHNER